MKGGRIIYTHAYGLARLEPKTPATTGMRYSIGSVSKQFTAACLLLLQRDGLLSLDDDVRRHLPELLLPVPVTLRQCLSHTGGLREYYSLCELAGVPAVEVHLSDVDSREDWRRVSVLEGLSVGRVSGKGVDGYREALELLKAELGA